MPGIFVPMCLRCFVFSFVLLHACSSFRREEESGEKCCIHSTYFSFPTKRKGSKRKVLCPPTAPREDTGYTLCTQFAVQQHGAGFPDRVGFRWSSFVSILFFHSFLYIIKAGKKAPSWVRLHFSFVLFFPAVCFRRFVFS